jgi:hypothetical protein
MFRELGRVGDEPQMVPLYHYTDAAGLLGILSSRKIFATHPRHLNDRNEFILGEGIIEEELQRHGAQFNNSKERLFMDHFLPFHQTHKLSVRGVFVTSLTKNDDQLSQWRGYGGRGMGCAIGFKSIPRPDPNSRESPLTVSLMSCQYDAQTFREMVRQQIKRMVDGFSRYCETYAKTPDDLAEFAGAAAAAGISQLLDLAARLKHHAFREEDEWRLVAVVNEPHKPIKFRATPRGVVSYVEVDLAKDGELIDLHGVVSGPSQEKEVATPAARLLLEELLYDPNLVRESDAPFRG